MTGEHAGPRPSKRSGGTRSGHGTSIPGWWVEWIVDGEPRRVGLRDLVHVGRSPEMDVALADPYVSRSHCTISLVEGRPLVDARGSRNHVRVAGRDVEVTYLESGEAFLVGRTTLRAVRASDDEVTLVLTTDPRLLVLHRSTRELVDFEGTLIARFSTAEFAAVELLALRHPEAASHADLGRAIWGDIGYDQYQIHRLMQRVRQRLGDGAGLLENVRAAGYRLTAPVEVR